MVFAGSDDHNSVFVNITGRSEKTAKRLKKHASSQEPPGTKSV